MYIFIISIMMSWASPDAPGVDLVASYQDAVVFSHPDGRSAAVVSLLENNAFVSRDPVRCVTEKHIWQGQGLTGDVDHDLDRVAFVLFQLKDREAFETELTGSRQGEAPCASAKARYLEQLRSSGFNQIDLVTSHIQTLLYNLNEYPVQN